jgi:16S rRNA (uracil1498-N3)-methyltransferase
VRRLGVGELLGITDGRGRLLRCRVTAVDSSGLTGEVIAVVQSPPPQPRITVVQALVKGERAESAVSQMTEAGVDEIVPWQASRCIVQWRGDRAQRGRKRWEAVAREAAKQSRRSWHPIIADPADLDEVAARCGAAHLAVVLHEAATLSLTDVSLATVGDLVVVVGPEGGIAEGELAALQAAGAAAYRMGPEVIRSANAGAIAAAVLASRTARWALPG